MCWRWDVPCDVRRGRHTAAGRRFLQGSRYRRIDALPGVTKTWRSGDRRSVARWRAAPSLPASTSADGHAHARRCRRSQGATAFHLSRIFCGGLAFLLLPAAISNALDDQNNDQSANQRARRDIHQRDARTAHVPQPQDAIPTGTSIGPIPCCNSSAGPSSKKSACWRHTASLASPWILTTNTSFLEPTPTIYSSFDEGAMFGGRLFIHTSANPYALAPSAGHARVIRDMSADQPVERAATLEDIRAEVLTPDQFKLAASVWRIRGCRAGHRRGGRRGRAGVFGGARGTREFGIRLALGSEPERLLKAVSDQRGHRDGCGGRPLRRRGIRVRAGALGGKIFRGCEDVTGRIAAGGRFCVRAG